MAAQASGAGKSHCYRTADSTLRPEICGKEEAAFRFRSWQGGGKSCGRTAADWDCKATLCGQRAVIDGLTFPRSSQVACASAPAQ